MVIFPGRVRPQCCVRELSFIRSENTARNAVFAMSVGKCPVMVYGEKHIRTLSDVLCPKCAPFLFQSKEPLCVVVHAQ